MPPDLTKLMIALEAFVAIVAVAVFVTAIRVARRSRGANSGKKVSESHAPDTGDGDGD